MEYFISMIENTFATFQLDIIDTLLVDTSSVFNTEMKIAGQQGKLAFILLTVDLGVLNRFQTKYIEFLKSKNLNVDEVSDNYPVYTFNDLLLYSDKVESKSFYSFSTVLNPKGSFFSIETIESLVGSDYRVSTRDAYVISAPLLVTTSMEILIKITPSLLLAAIKQIEVETLLGKIKVTEDNGISQPFHIWRKTQDQYPVQLIQSLYSHVLIEPFRLQFTINKSVSCVFKDGIGAKIANPFLIVGIILVSANKHSSENEALLLSYLITFEYFNTYDKIFDSYCIPYVINAETVSDIKETVTFYTDMYKIKYYFGLSRKEERMAISPVLLEKNLILFYSLNYEGNECYYHIFNTGFPATSLRSWIQFIDKVYPNIPVFQIYSSDEYSATIADSMLYFLNQNDIENNGRIKIDNDISKVDSFVDTMKTSLPAGGLIIVTVSEQLKVPILKVLYDNNMIPPLYIAIVYDLDIATLDEINPDIMKAHYYITTSKLSESDITKTFVNFVSNSIGYVRPLNTIFRQSATAVFLFKAAVESAKTFEMVILVDILRKISVETIIGISQFYENNVLNNILYLYKLNTNINNKLESELITQTSELEKPDPWKIDIIKNQKYFCSWDLAFNDPKIEIDSKRVLLFLEENSETNNYVVNAVSSSIAQVNNLNVLPFVLEEKLIFYHTDDNLSAVLRPFLEDEKLSFIIGCEQKECRDAILPLLTQYNQLLFFPYPFEAFECRRNIMYAGLIPYHILTLTASTIYSNAFYRNSDTILLMSSNADWDAYSPTIEVVADELFKISLIISKTDSAIFTSSDVELILSKLSSGGCIISTLSHFTFSSFMSIFKKHYLDSNYIAIFNIRNYPGEFTDLEEINRVYFTLGWSPTVETSFTSKFKIAMEEFSLSTHIHQLSYSAYLGMEAYIYAAKIDPTVKGIDILDFLYFKNIGSEDEKLQLINNNYFARQIYIVHILNGEIIPYLHSFQIPKAHHWKMPGNGGLICNVKLSPPVFAVGVIRILIVMQYSGARTRKHNGVVEAASAFCDKYNELDGGLLGNILYLSILDDGSDVFNGQKIVLSYLEDQSFKVFITSGQIELIQMLEQDLGRLNVMILKLDTFGGEYCYENVFSVGMEPSALEDIIEFETFIEQSNLSFITLNDITGTIFLNYFSQYASTVNSDLVYTVSLSQTLTSEMETALQGIQMRMDRGVIFFYLTAAILKEFLLEIRRMGLDEKYKLVVIGFGENLMDENLPEYLTVGSYFSSIDSPENTEFIKMMKNQLPFSVSETEMMANTYTSLEIWRKAVLKANSFDFKEVKKYIYTIQHNGPAGLASFTPSNILLQPKRVIKIYPNLTTNIVKTYTITNVMRVWKRFLNEYYYICDFTDTSKGAKSIVPFITVGLVIPFSGSDKTKGYETYLVINYLINEISEGMLIGNKIQVSIYDTESDIEKLKSGISTFLELSNIDFIFGGYREEEREIFSKQMETTNKLGFFLGDTTGLTCYSKIISLGSSSQIFIQSLFALLTNNRSPVIVIYGDSYLSKDMKNSLGNFFELSATESYFIEFIDNEKLFSEIHSLAPAAFIINIVPFNEKLDYLYKFQDNNIVEPNYKVISYFIPEIFIKTNKEKMENQIFIATWFSFISSTESSEFIEIKSLSEGLRGYSMSSEFNKESEYTLYTYYAFSLWMSSVKASNSFEPDLVRRNIYNRVILGPFGYVKLNNDGLLNQKIYIAKLENGELLLQPERPLNFVNNAMFSPWLSGHDGKFCNLEENEGMEIKPIIIFGLVLESNEIYRYRILGSLISLLYTIDDLNNKGGIDKRLLAIRTYFGKVLDNEIPSKNEKKSEVEVKQNYFNSFNATINIDPLPKAVQKSADLSNKDMDIKIVLEEVIKKNEVDCLLACTSLYCRNYLFELADKYKRFGFYIGNTGENTSKYVLSMGPTIYQRSRICLDYLSNIYTNYYIIVQSNRKE